MSLHLAYIHTSYCASNCSFIYVMRKNLIYYELKYIYRLNVKPIKQPENLFSKFIKNERLYLFSPYRQIDKHHILNKSLRALSKIGMVLYQINKSNCQLYRLLYHRTAVNRHRQF